VSIVRRDYGSLHSPSIGSFVGGGISIAVNENVVFGGAM
jgi:hypothetical protein